jgi:hypothetical protein
MKRKISSPTKRPGVSNLGDQYCEILRLREQIQRAEPNYRSETIELDARSLEKKPSISEKQK